MWNDAPPTKGYRIWYKQTFNEIDKQLYLILNVVIWPIWILVIVGRGLTEGFLSFRGNVFMFCAGLGIAFGMPLIIKARDCFFDGKTLKYDIPKPAYGVAAWSLLQLLKAYMKEHGYAVNDKKYNETLIISNDNTVRLDITDRGSGPNAYFTVVLCQRKSSDAFFTDMQMFIEQKIGVIYTEKRLSDLVDDLRGTEDGEPGEDDAGAAHHPIPEWLSGTWKLEFADRSVYENETTDSKTVIHRSGDTPAGKIVREDIAEDLSRGIYHLSIAAGFATDAYPNGYVLAKDPATGELIIPKGFKCVGTEKIKTDFSEFDAMHTSFEGLRDCDFCNGRKRMFKCPFCKGKGISDKSEHFWYETETGILLASQDKDNSDGSEIKHRLLSASGILGQ